jgi:hypothetical protein
MFAGAIGEAAISAFTLSLAVIAEAEEAVKIDLFKSIPWKAMNCCY